MSDGPNNVPPTPGALERTLNEMLAGEPVLDGRNGRHLQETVEQLVGDLVADGQLKSKLMSETKVGFGMALGKFLAWKAWSDIEKSDRRKTAGRLRPTGLRLTVPSDRLLEVKSRWGTVRAEFQQKVGFSLPESTLEPGEGEWVLEIRGGLLGRQTLPDEWMDPLVRFLSASAYRLLTLPLVKQLVDDVKNAEPVLAEEMERLRLPITAVYRVLEILLSEQVPVHEMETILTALILGWEHGTDRNQLVASARRALSPWICKRVETSPGLLHAIKLGRRVENLLDESLRFVGSEQVLSLEPHHVLMVKVLLQQSLNNLKDTSSQPILLASPRVRRQLRMLVQQELPDLTVLSGTEIHPGYQVKVLAVVDFKEQPPTVAASLPSDNDGSITLF